MKTVYRVNLWTAKGELCGYIWHESIREAWVASIRELVKWEPFPADDQLSEARPVPQGADDSCGEF